MLQKLILKWLGGSYLEKLLAMLPGNGYKTIIGLIVTVIVIALQAFEGQAFPGANILTWIAHWWQIDQGQTIALSKEDIATLIAISTTLVGLLHKVLKWIDGQSRQFKQLG